jgi:hypothetical protein
MTALATATITGHEAHGTATLVDDGGTLRLELTDRRVAPGPPDVRLYLTADGDRRRHRIDLGHVPDRTPTITAPSRRAPTSPGSRPLPCTARCTRSTSAPEP